MPFAYNIKTNSIRMAVGDTGGFKIKVTWDKLSAGDVILFAIFDPAVSKDQLCKPIPIEDGFAQVRLCNHDTRDIAPGKYSWNLRIVTSPSYDEDGAIRVDECSDEVVTIFDNPPNIILTKGGASV